MAKSQQKYKLSDKNRKLVMDLARENEELSRDVMKLQSALDIHHRQVDSENKSVRGMMRKAIGGARWQAGAQGKLTTFKSISDIEDDVLGDIENSRMEKKRAVNKRPPSGRQPAAIKNSSVPKDSTLLYNQGTKGSVGREPTTDRLTAGGKDKISERKPVIRDNICEREARHIEGQNPALGFIGMDVAQPSKIMKRPSSASGTRGQKAGKPKGVLIDRKHKRSLSTQSKESGGDFVVNGKKRMQSTQKVSFDEEVKDAEDNVCNGELEEPEVQIVTTGKTYQDRLVSMRAKVLNDTNNDQVNAKPQRYMNKTISAKLKANSAPPAAKTNHTRRREGIGVRSEVTTSCDPAVAAWLASLNLMEQDKYVKIFADNEIDLEGLRLLSEDQLARMGVTAIGAMNKIMFGVEQLRNSFDKAKEKSTKAEALTTERKEPVKGKPFSARVTKRPASSGTRSVDVVPKERKSKRPVSADVVRRSRAGVKQAAEKASHRQQEEERQKRQKERMEQRKKAERDKMAARFLEKRKEAELKEEMTAEDRGSSGASSSPDMELEDIESNVDSSRTTSQASTWSREPQGISLTLEGLGLGKATPRGGESDGPDSGNTQGTGRKDSERRLDTGSRTNRSRQREHVSNDVELQVSGLQQRGKENEQTSREIVDKIQRQLEEIQMVYKPKSPTSPHNMAAQSHAGKDPGEEMIVPENTGNKREVGSGRPVAMTASPSKQDLMRQLRKEQDKHRKEIRHLESELKRLKFKDPLRNCQIVEKDIIYSTKDLLGEGAFSRVFRGVYNGTEVAIKRLRSPLSAADKNYFGAEVSLLRELRHPRVVLLLGVCTTADLPIMVLEYMAQGSLYHWLHGEERPDLDHVLYYQIARDTALGMNYLHNRKPAVLHLDLKSMNVLLDSQLRAKIADFGFSKLRHDADVKASQSGHLRGTPAWMAPELINQGNITTKVDVYSFGMILWEMLTRKHPYLGLSMFQVMECVRLNQRPEIPDYCPIGLSRLIGLCWAHNPARRSSFKDILISLESLSFPPEWRSLLSAAGIPRQAMEDANSAQRIIHLVSNSVVLNREELDKAVVTGEVPRSDDQGLDTAKLTNSNTEQKDNFPTGGNPWADTKLDLDFGSSSDDEAAFQGNHINTHGVSSAAMAQSLTKRTYKISSPRKEEVHKVHKSVHVPRMWKGTWADSEDRPEVEASEDSGSEDSLEASIQIADRDSDPKSGRDVGARVTGMTAPPPPPPVADYEKYLQRTSYVSPEQLQVKKVQQSKENSACGGANRHKKGLPKTAQPVIPASLLQEQKQRLRPVDLTRPQELPDISRVGQDRLVTIAEILKKAVGERRVAMNMADDIHSIEQSYSAVWSVDN